MSPLSWDTIRLLLPEVLLLILATFTFVFGAFSKNRSSFNLILLAGLALCGISMVYQDDLLKIFTQNLGPLATGPLVLDAFGHSIRWLVLVSGLLLLLSMWKAGDEAFATEYIGSLFLILAGLMLVARANDLVLLFLGLELVSIPTYIMLFIGRSKLAAHEATTKYFYLSLLSSAIMLYGFAWIYGITGTTQILQMPGQAELSGMAESSNGLFLTQFAPVAMVLIFAGFSFKLAAVPFHFYAPDVYEGTTANNAALLAVAPKIAGIVALLRLAFSGFAGQEVLQLGWQMAFAVAILTMTLGNFMALLQSNIRRMMAYSSIAHAGYLFIGIAVALAVASGEATTAQYSPVSATLYYLIVYILATLGLFAALTFLANSKSEVNTVQELAGVAKKHPWVAASMAVCLFSLTGVPPFAGFWGKLTLLLGGLSFNPELVSESTRRWFLILVVVGAINAAISAGYYLRILGVLYFQPADTNATKAEATGSSGPLVATVLAAALVIGTGLLPGYIMGRVGNAGRQLVPPKLQQAISPKSIPLQKTASNIKNRAEQILPHQQQIPSVSARRHTHAS